MKRTAAQRIETPQAVNVYLKQYEDMSELQRRRIDNTLAAHGLEVGSVTNRQCFWFELGELWIWAATRRAAR